MARSYTGKKGVFHANFHDAHRHTPNDEKSAGFCRGGFQTRPYETVLRRYVGDTSLR